MIKQNGAWDESKHPRDDGEDPNKASFSAMHLASKMRAEVCEYKRRK